jgi:hypothetical protein
MELDIMLVDYFGQITECGQKEYLKILEKVGAKKNCYRCKSSKLTVINQFGEIKFPNWKHIPFIVVCCKNCGAITQHTLNFIDSNKEKENDQNT